MPFLSNENCGFGRLHIKKSHFFYEINKIKIFYLLLFTQLRETVKALESFSLKNRGIETLK